MWLHISTKYMATLRPLANIKPKLQLKFLFLVRMRPHFATQCLLIKFKISVQIFCVKLFLVISYMHCITF